MVLFFMYCFRSLILLIILSSLSTKFHKKFNVVVIVGRSSNISIIVLLDLLFSEHPFPFDLGVVVCVFPRGELDFGTCTYLYIF